MAHAQRNEINEFQFKRTIYESVRAWREREESSQLRWAIDSRGSVATCTAARQLHTAVARGDVSWARALLQEDPARCDERDGRGRTVLHLAAWTGHEAMLRFLKDVGVDVACEDIHGNRPLHYAAWDGHESAVRTLIDMGASVDHVDKFGQTALHLAAVRGHSSAARALLQKGADASLATKTGIKPLEFAVNYGHHLMVSIFLRNNVKIDKTSLLLHRAARRGDRTMVRMLIEARVSVEDVDECGRTALHLAAQGGHVAVIGMLHQERASIDHADNEGKTPLHAAAERGSDAAVDMLVRLGANVKKFTRDRKTALDFAVERGCDSMVHTLRTRSDATACYKTSPSDKHNRETSSASDETHSPEAGVQTPTTQCMSCPKNDGSDDVNEASEEVGRQAFSISRLQNVYGNASSTSHELRRALREALDQLSALEKRGDVDTSRSLSDGTSGLVCSPNGAASDGVQVDAQQRRIQNTDDSQVNRKRKFEADYDQACQSFKQWKPTIESRDDLMQKTKPQLQQVYLALFGKRASNQKKKAKLVDALIPMILGAREEAADAENRQMSIPNIIDLTDDHA